QSRPARRPRCRASGSRGVQGQRLAGKISCIAFALSRACRSERQILTRKNPWRGRFPPFRRRLRALQIPAAISRPSSVGLPRGGALLALTFSTVKLFYLAGRRLRLGVAY